MLAFKALSVAFREMQAPELEATLRELAEVSTRLREVESELNLERAEGRFRAVLDERVEHLNRENLILEQIIDDLRSYISEPNTGSIDGRLAHPLR